MTYATSTTRSEGVDSALALELYRMMLRVRLFDERVGRLYVQGETQGPCHLSLGHEAIAAGVARAMGPSELTFCTYRSHAHTICKGVPLDLIMSELLGRGNGLMGGKGGSMHLTSVEHGLMGSNAIIGAHLPIALGAAWAAAQQGRRQVVVCFFGDGATNIGAFHEALNLASLWKVPAVYVCENNQYMEYSPIETVTAVKRPAADRAPGYGLQPQVVDGNSAEDMYAAAVEAIESARGGGGPHLIEAVTFRQGGHSMADPGKYRSEAEISAGLERDPIPRMRERLRDLGVPDCRVDEVMSEEKQAVDEAAAYAKASALPELSTLETNVWADGGSAWRN